MFSKNKVNNDKNIKVNRGWLENMDSCGRKLSSFIIIKCESTVLCQPCQSTINVRNKGYQAIQQHVKCEKHFEKINFFFNENRNQLQLLSSSQVNHSGIQ